MRLILASKERYWSPLQLCLECQNLLRPLRYPKVDINRDCSVWWDFRTWTKLISVIAPTKPHPNKRFNPRNLIARIGSWFGVSPRATTGSTPMERPASTPSFSSLPLPALHRTTILAVSTLSPSQSTPNVSNPSWTARGTRDWWEKLREEMTPNRF
jgi:hypothetical protein